MGEYFLQSVFHPTVSVCDWEQTERPYGDAKMAVLAERLSELLNVLYSGDLLSAHTQKVGEKSVAWHLYQAVMLYCKPLWIVPSSDGQHVLPGIYRSNCWMCSLWMTTWLLWHSGPESLCHTTAQGCLHCLGTVGGCCCHPFGPAGRCRQRN